MIKLYSYSVQNKLHGHSDTDAIVRGNSTEMDNIVEYAARVCYKSTDRMGDSPNFIQKRIAERHEDVVEHGYVVFEIDTNQSRSLGTGDFDSILNRVYSWYRFSRFINVWEIWKPETRTINIVVGANVRTWLQLARKILEPIGTIWDIKVMKEIIPYLVYLAPSVFSEFMDYKKPVDVPYHELFNVPTHYSSSSPATITLLGASQGTQTTDIDTLIQATFLIEGVSRALSHQLVRYRLLSFSQESQRYVDLEKGDWGIVVPPHLDEKDFDVEVPYYEHAFDHGTKSTEYTGQELFDEIWSRDKESYRQLRKAGVRKEDARMILPNMVETRLVVSGTLEGWRNAIWQRCAKSAQWEIRGVFIEILKTLYTLYPSHFETEAKEFLK